MSTEEEFRRWLQRPEKTFTENLQFALKAWKSAEFTLPSKYQIVMDWLSQQGEHLGRDTQTLQLTELTDLLQLRCQPGLIAQQVKMEFVQMWLRWAADWQSPESRDLPELLQQLAECEILQDLFRSNYELYAQLFGQLLHGYELYLWRIKSTELLPSHESTFCMKLLNTLRESAKKTGDPELFDQEHVKHVLQPLVQVLLVFQQHGLYFFDEFLSLEQMLCKDLQASEMVERLLCLPMHACLLTLQCAIVNQRGVEIFQEQLLTFIFERLLEEQKQQDPALMLTTAAFTLEVFRKHDISLNFETGSGHSALAYLSEKVNVYVEQFRDRHLQQVLQLLCSTLRLNPLILEKNIFQYTVWLLVVEKRTPFEQRLYEEYLVLLLDMFRKLSRAEKFVVNLLRKLDEWLQNFKIVGSAGGRGKSKSKAEMSESSDATPKKKPKMESYSGQNASGPDVSKYLQIIFKEFHSTASQTSTSVQSSPQSFPHLRSVWPWNSVGLAFSKLIMGLTSKASLVVWKALIYSLKELLEKLSSKQEMSENDELQLDLISALLCQYFAGSKLAEQSDKFWPEIAAQHKLTVDLLSQFGRFLLGLPHNKRSMNAFLECSYYSAHFQLLVCYYRSDRLAESAPYQQLAKQIHDFLTDEEWTLLQQRVINFGKARCKFNMNRLLLQRSQARRLLSSKSKTLSLQKILLTPIANDVEQLQLLLQTSNAQWLLHNLRRCEKLDIIRWISSVPSFDYTRCRVCTEDLEFFELLCLGLFEHLAENFAETAKKSILGSISFDELKIETNPASDKRVASIVEVINARSAPYALKKLPVDQVQETLEALKKLPVGNCRRQVKGILFALHLALFRDLKAGEQDELAAVTFDCIKDLLHFGQRIQIFKYFPIQSMLQLLPVASCWEFYEFLFSSSLRNEEKGAEDFLNELVDILRTAQQQEQLDEGLLKLALISIETLSAFASSRVKRWNKHLAEVLAIYASYVNSFFAQLTERNAKKDKRFVGKTLPGFPAYLKSKLGCEEKKTELDEDFRRICEIYISYSMDYKNTHAIELISVALNHCEALHLDQEKIEFVLNTYWNQLNADLKANELNENNAEAVIKLVISKRTNEDLLLALKDISADIKEQDFGNIMHLLTLMARCQFTTIKGAIFNDMFKKITFEIMSRLPKDQHLQYVSTELILQTLMCQQAVVDNRTVPISSDTLDDILSFLVEVGIKKFPLSDTNMKLFNSLHLAMTELCSSLLKHHHVLLMDRWPQFMHIFKDLLQAIVWYKSDRQKDTALGSEELDDLVKLSLKLEALMHIIATHGLEVKRVAPFVLTFAINLMVANKRATTLYPKIKTHIENICYDLVSICDHRAGRFILRCSNEAARQVYELLVKDHAKYIKFKGKV